MMSKAVYAVMRTVAKQKEKTYLVQSCCETRRKGGGRTHLHNSINFNLFDPFSRVLFEVSRTWYPPVCAVRTYTRSVAVTEENAA